MTHRLSHNKCQARQARDAQPLRPLADDAQALAQQLPSHKGQGRTASKAIGS